ncbi:MAG: hypothetical protein ABWY83_04625 [Actinomycetota bacterium]
MDTRRGIGRAVLVATVVVGMAGWRARSGVAIEGGSPAQTVMTLESAGRFREAGLGEPTVRIRFHDDREACDGRTGRSWNGTVDLCGIHTNDLSRRTVLHEMAHAWLDAHVTAGLEERFLRLRQLERWNDHDDEWEQRGSEQAAEIVEWALAGQGTGTELPSIPHNDPPQLAEAYELLTGRPLPD